MKVEYPKAKEFYRYFNAIKKVVTDVNASFRSDGLVIQGVDGSRVAFARLRVPSGAFASYDVEEQKAIGLPVKKFKNVLKRGRVEDAVRLSLGDEKIGVTFIGEKKVQERNFTIPTVDTTESMPEVDELELGQRVELSDPGTFSAIVGDAAVFAPVLELRTDPDQKVIRCRGRSTIGSEYEGELRLQNMETVLSYDVDEQCFSLYSSEFLGDMDTPNHFSKTLTVEFGGDLPLRKEYAVKEGIRIEFVLAPRKD